MVLVFERHQAQPELIGAVFRKGSLFKAVLFEKGADPQCSQPFWSERRPEALFNDEGEVISHAQRLLNNAAM
jgi:hypothetical protein